MDNESINAGREYPADPGYSRGNDNSGASPRVGPGSTYDIAARRADGGTTSLLGLSSPQTFSSVPRLEPTLDRSGDADYLRSIGKNAGPSSLAELVQSFATPKPVAPQQPRSKLARIVGRQ